MNTADLCEEDREEIRKFERWLKRCNEGAKQVTAYHEVYDGIVFGQLMTASAQERDEAKRSLTGGERELPGSEESGG